MILDITQNPQNPEGGVMIFQHNVIPSGFYFNNVLLKL